MNTWILIVVLGLQIGNSPTVRDIDSVVIEGFSSEDSCKVAMKEIIDEGLLVTDSICIEKK